MQVCDKHGPHYAVRCPACDAYAAGKRAASDSLGRLVGGGSLRRLIRNMRRMEEDGAVFRCRGCGKRDMKINAEHHKGCTANARLDRTGTAGEEVGHGE